MEELKLDQMNVTVDEDKDILFTDSVDVDVQFIVFRNEIPALIEWLQQQV